MVNPYCVNDTGHSDIEADQNDVTDDEDEMMDFRYHPDD